MTAFRDRHIGPREADIRRMLDILGYADMEAFLSDVVPQHIREWDGLDLPPAPMQPRVHQVHGISLG